MTSLTEFFNKHEDDALKGISHKNSIIKRNIIAPWPSTANARFRS